MMLIDQEARDNILNDDKDMVISASAGSGKTTIMVKKIGIEIEKIENHKTVAALTFTVKATNEIKKKSETGIKKTFIIMTNDCFIEHEIIRPFIKDAFGNQFEDNYCVEYSQEYKFTEYSEGLKQLKDKNILGGFKDNKLNFNFKIAISILEKSVAAQEYIKSKYSWIFIDEYQDCDRDMHYFFMKIKNELNIKLFIVGDLKQAIYLWRGARQDIFELLEHENFNFYKLVSNFRSHIEIQNFANILHDSSHDIEFNEEAENVILKEYNNSLEKLKFVGFLDEFNDLILKKNLSLDKEITIIANYNEDAQMISNLLEVGGFNFDFIPKVPIEEGIPNGYLLKELAYFSKNSEYTIYDFLEKNNIDERISTRIEVNNIIEQLQKNKKISLNSVEEIVLRLANYLQISVSEDEIKKFHESISNSKYDKAFKLDESKYKVMTVFAAKGLEFDQVISFSRYYKIYNNQDLEKHYVCITRAKEKFIMFIDDKLYYRYILGIATKKGVKEISKLIKYE